MKARYILGLTGVLVGTGVALAIGLTRSGATGKGTIASLPVGDQGGAAIAQPTTAPPTMMQQAGAQTATTPPVTTTSSAAAIALAKHLKSIGAKMYGAYWCPHCHDQLQLFGQKAVAQLPYIECAEDGKNARPDLCEKAKIEGYPTWKIKGKTLPGTQPLADLAAASGYKGSRNF